VTLRRIITPLAMASVIAACSSSMEPASQTATDAGGYVSSATVNATPSIAFTPANVKLSAGGTVTFAFGGVGHNVFFDDDPAGAPASIDGVNANTSVQRTFSAPGVYNYNCHIHPGMRGTVIVGAATDTTTQSDSTGYGGYNRIPRTRRS
jgi:plastocyanin